ncbi:MAG: DUF551 domain-containing protein [Lachnospiraceae bacterium]|nr:DUF551 domain-containing protein [Lachnospiraceae bacterium]
MRLIDADDLYELIDGGYDLDFSELPETKRELLRMIDDQPTIDVPDRKVGEWTPVSESLPKPNEKEGDVQRYYLIQNEFGDMMVAAYLSNTAGETWWEQMYAYEPVEDEVIAWMPLPERYGGNENGEDRG